MSETSLMSLSKIRIRHMQEEGVKGAKLVSNLIEDSNKLLSTILVGNNVVNIAATSISTALFTSLIPGAQWSCSGYCSHDSFSIIIWRNNS